jgi:Fe-S oxidoreductase
MVKILQASHVNFVVLGTEEKCNCEAARRVGEEGRFQQSAIELVELLKKYNVKEVLTQCPHCFNTFSNEYPKFDGSFRVIHHSQFIEELIKTGKLKLKEGTEKVVTFHDPCYLGRYNGVFDSPRQVVSSLGNVRLTEMKRSRENSFCCGAGGGNMWYKVEQKKKISAIRFGEAQESHANVLATACPFCTSMLQDASVAAEAREPIEVLDIAELVAAQI